MANNQGLLFEWCIYYLICQSLDKVIKENFDEAERKWKSAPPAVKSAAQRAITVVTRKYGNITDVKKISGGIEPKTDLVISTRSKKLRCSLKYGNAVQLSSGGIKNTVQFLTGVLKNIKTREGYDEKQITQIIASLAEFEESHGDIGKLPRQQIDEHFAKAERYDLLLKDILGSRKYPKVTEEYEKIKLAIIEEAMTGKYTFGATSDETADYILTDSYIRHIDDRFIQETADKTSVRLALKGRGKIITKDAIIRVNEIVVRFDAG